MKKAKTLRRMLTEDGIIVAPGAHDAITAMIIEEAGFQAIYMGSYAISASVLGKPDVSLMTLTETVRCARYIDNAVNVPVIADSEAGFGNAINVMRAVKEFEKAGIAAIHIEDQIVPKMWNTGDVQVCSMEEHVKKIEAALEAREDEDFVIIARTDSRSTYGIEEAIRRGKAYARAGADVVFVHGLRSIEELETIPKTIKAPTLVNFSNLIEFGVTPLPNVGDIEKMGFKIVIFPSFSNLAEAKATRDFTEELKRTGSIEGFLRYVGSFDEFVKLTGLPKIKALERKFIK